jgi:hypothetical protein
MFADSRRAFEYDASAMELEARRPRVVCVVVLRCVGAKSYYPQMPTSRIAPATVAFARIGILHDQPPLEGLEAALIASLVPGTMVERYDRLWRLGPPATEARKLHGKVGYQSAGNLNEIWDDERLDFVGVPQGQSTPYAIDLESMLIAFQVRGQQIKKNTFRGNFQGLLRQASNHDWIVRLEGVAQLPWEEWLDHIDRLVKLDVTMNRPNPRYPGTLLEDFFEGTKIAAGKLGLKAAEDGSIDIESSEFLKQSLALAENYGHYTAVGAIETPVGRPAKETWKSSLEGEAAHVTVEPDPETRDVPFTSLDEQLDAHSPTPAVEHLE